MNAEKMSALGRSGRLLLSSQVVSLNARLVEVTGVEVEGPTVIELLESASQGLHSTD